VAVSGTFNVVQVVGSVTSAPSAVITISIHPFPQAVNLPLGPFCTNSAPVVLQGSPPGGSYVGMGVTGNTFYPASANVGSNNYIIYHYSQTFGNETCYDTAAVRITVSTCAGIQESETPDDLTVHPLPGGRLFAVSFPHEPPRSISIKDMGGREILYHL
jgi:hypothetical protein